MVSNYLSNYFYKIKQNPEIKILSWYCQFWYGMYQIAGGHVLFFVTIKKVTLNQVQQQTMTSRFSDKYCNKLSLIFRRIILANCLIYRYLLFILRKKTQIGIKRDLVKEDSKIFQKCTTFVEDESLTRQVDYSRTQWQPFFNTVQDRRN